MTVLVGDNGSGKSTIVEAIAVAAGFNVEGGGRNLQFATLSTHSDLHEHLELRWRQRPRWGWFLRAETFCGSRRPQHDLRQLSRAHRVGDRLADAGRTDDRGLPSIGLPKHRGYMVGATRTQSSRQLWSE